MFNVEQFMSRTAGVIVKEKRGGGETHKFSSVRPVHIWGGGVSTLGKCKHGGVFGWSLAFRGSSKWHLVTAKTNRAWCARASVMRVRLRALMRAQCVAAKCHCVSAKTNRPNEKQLLGQRARKWGRQRPRDGGDPARPNTLTPLSLSHGLWRYTVPSVL